MSEVREFHYRLGAPVRASWPGHHRGTQRGAGTQMCHVAPLLDAPDPRRYDVWASLRDPFERPMVRVYHPPSALCVVCLVDVSASMDFIGVADKFRLVCDFLASAAYSAERTGDRFGCFAAGEHVVEPLCLRPTRHRATVQALVQRFAETRPHSGSANALLAAAQRVGVRPSLVFVLSDFHWPDALLETLLAQLTRHWVVPVVLWDRAEYQRLPRFGWARLRESESERTRLVWMRRSLRAAIIERAEQHRETLAARCRRAGLVPLWLDGPFDAEAVTRYFHA